jgi:TonB family protein
MFPQPKSRPEFRPDDSHPEAVRILEQHLRAGFPSDLAVDLVFNELVIRAVEATHATAGALALLRNGEMICRAATGYPAPDLGFPINLRDGLSGACLKSHEAQTCTDTESDPRVGSIVSRYLGIRSILVVPVFDNNSANFAGILEVFSTSPSAFSSSEQKLLEGFAEECAHVRQAAIEPSKSKSEVGPIQLELLKPELLKPELLKPESLKPESLKPELPKPELVGVEFVESELAKMEPATPEPAAASSAEASTAASETTASEPAAFELTPPEFLLPGEAPALPEVASPLLSQPRYEGWTLVLGGLAILAIVSVSFLIGSRIGWLRFAAPRAKPRLEAAQPVPPEPAEQKAAATAAQPPRHSRSAKTSEKASRQPAPTPADPAAGELVVYDKGKVIFRMKSAPASTDTPKQQEAVPDSSTVGDTDATPSTQPAPTQIGASPSVWISPAAADTLLLSRTEPHYPAKARAARRSGNVVLEVLVAEDGSVSKVRTLSGDPVLAAAAKEAVRNWRYQPYRQNDHPAQFQTDVTLSFALPN